MCLGVDLLSGCSPDRADTKRDCRDLDRDRLVGLSARTWAAHLNVTPWLISPSPATLARSSRGHVVHHRIGHTRSHQVTRQRPPLSHPHEDPTSRWAHPDAHWKRGGNKGPE